MSSWPVKQWTCILRAQNPKLEVSASKAAQLTRTTIASTLHVQRAPASPSIAADASWHAASGAHAHFKLADRVLQTKTCVASCQEQVPVGQMPSNPQPTAPLSFKQARDGYPGVDTHCCIGQTNFTIVLIQPSFFSYSASGGARTWCACPRRGRRCRGRQSSARPASGARPASTRRSGGRGSAGSPVARVG